MREGLKIVGITSLLAAGSACGSLDDSPTWWDSLEPDSPCYGIDIADGVDESEEGLVEMRGIFECLNYRHHFDAIDATVGSLETNTSRDGVQSGIELLRMLHAMPEVDVDPMALAGFLLDALQAEDRPIEEILDLLLELIYGQRAGLVRTEVDLKNDIALKRGLLVPIGDLATPLSTVLLDDDLEVGVWAADLLASDETKRWIRTFEAWTTSEHPEVSEPLDVILPHLGDAILATRSPGNDIWTNATGDSLEDVIVVATRIGEPTLIEKMGPDVTSLVDDPIVRANLETTMLDLHDQGVLQEVASDLKWMASVDVEGQPLDPGERSALYRFIRLLASTNQSTYCELDLWLTSITIDLPNLAVAILDLLADLDPDTVQSGIGLLATIIDSDITEFIMREAVDAGVCPDFTHETLDDLQAVDVMTRPEAQDLLTFLVDLLAVLKYGESNHIPELANVGEILFDHGALPPVEELVRDIGDEPAMADVMQIIPAMAEPDLYGLQAGDEPAVDFQDMVALLVWVWEPDADDGLTGWERMEPLVGPMVDNDTTWVLVGNLATLMSDPDSQTAQLLDLLPTILAIDPELELLDEFGPLLGNKSIGLPLLRMVEADGGTTGSVLAAAPQGSHDEVPLAFASRLIVDGTLEDLLSLVDILLASLDGDSEGEDG